MENFTNISLDNDLLNWYNNKCDIIPVFSKQPNKFPSYSPPPERGGEYDKSQMYFLIGELYKPKKKRCRMNKRLFNAVLATALCASLLCGCVDITEKLPFRADTDTASGSSYQQSSEASQPKPVSSSTYSSSSSTRPQSTASSTIPQSTVSSTQPQSTASSTKPQSTSSGPKLPSISSILKPHSTVSSTEPRQPVSSPEPQYSSSVETTQSASEPYQQPVIDPSPDGSVINAYTSKWAYNNITEKQRQLYIRLYNTASNVGGYCDISDLGLTVDDIYTAFWAFDYENPQFLELGSGYQYSYKESADGITIVGITIEYGRSTANVPQSEFDATAQTVLANARAMATDYERLKYVHDWIINNTRYIKADTAYESEADGPVVYGTAICEGYSKAFMYFAQSMGYECICAIGGAGGIDHMWNIVKVNGQWYHVDATWDDPLVSDGSDMLRYDYFMLSDSEILRDHYIDTPFVLPSAPYSYVQ